MKYLFQFTIIGVITAIGELLNLLLPLPVPASIYGLVLLFAALCLKIIKLSQVEQAADFFLAIMPILFVPSTVNLMNYWGVLKSNVVGLVITCILSTVGVMGLTGTLAQLIMKKNTSQKISEEALDEMEAAEVPILESEGVYEENEEKTEKGGKDHE